MTMARGVRGKLVVGVLLMRGPKRKKIDSGFGWGGVSGYRTESALSIRSPGQTMVAYEKVGLGFKEEYLLSKKSSEKTVALKKEGGFKGSNPEKGQVIASTTRKSLMLLMRRQKLLILKTRQKIWV